MTLMLAAAPSDRVQQSAGAEQPQRARAVVVGVTTGPENLRVLEWAAAWARRSGASLHIVHAYRSSVASDHSGFVVWSNSKPVEVALALVEDAARRAKVHAPGLIVTASVKDGRTAAALLEEGQLADLIVVGRSRERRRWPWLRPLSNRMMLAAPGRVVVVNRLARGGADPWTAPDPTRELLPRSPKTSGARRASGKDSPPPMSSTTQPGGPPAPQTPVKADCEDA